MVVTNPVPAGGGREPETLDEAWRRLKTDLAVPSRAVTSEDFVALAKATPGVRVARAQALPGFDARDPDSTKEGVVTVVVVPYSFSDCPIPSAGFLRTVCCHLDRHRLITTDLRVIGPRYVAVSVAAAVTVRAKSAPSAVTARIEKALAEFLHPLRGGAGKTGWPFGRAVYRSELAGLIERIEGVECIEDLYIEAARAGIRTSERIEIPPEALVCPGRFQIAAKDPRPWCEAQ
jgi:predicted phage baseplate assembly protein